jgi:hypothetical protein
MLGGFFGPNPAPVHGLAPEDKTHRDTLRSGFFEQYLPAGGR